MSKDVEGSIQQAHTAQGGCWQRLRAYGLALLMVVVTLLGAGSVVLSSHFDQPRGMMGAMTQPTAAPTRADAARLPTPATSAAASSTPASCNCAGKPLTQIVAPPPPGGAPAIAGQVILVSLSRQWLWTFQNGWLVSASPVTTGQPALPTPTGIFHISKKVDDTTFYSPWPPGSPYYYTPVHVNYALLFRTGGYFIHDAPWREVFGPGTNVPHTDPDGTWETGSHGCVEVPTSFGAWLYGWAGYGTTVDIIP